MAKSVFFNSFLCLRRIHHQNPPNEAIKTTTIGTTIAGIRVARFPEPPEEADEDVAAAVAEVFEEVADAREAASAEVMEAKTAGSVMGTSPVLVETVATPSMVVGTSKRLVTTVRVAASVAVAMASSPVTEPPGPSTEGRGVSLPRSPMLTRERAQHRDDERKDCRWVSQTVGCLGV
jgi:hypothetical protein